MSNIYREVEAKILIYDGNPEFSTIKGIRQGEGDRISPKIFTATLENMFRNSDWDNDDLVINGE